MSQSVITDNVVGNNGGGGIIITGRNTSGTVITRNRVGISLTGVAIPNDGNGIETGFHAVNATIGPDNIITTRSTPSSSAPTDVDYTRREPRRTRSANSGMGIEIYPSGVNANGHNPTSAVNQSVPFPTIASATPTTATGRACASCTVEVFLSDGGGGAFGDGRTFVGSATASAAGAWTATLTGVAVGDLLTTTATNTAGSSSEFSLNRPVTASGALNPGTVIARDAFSRVLIDEWGSPTTGGPYTLPTDRTPFDVTGGLGTISVPASTLRGLQLASFDERDVDLTVQLRTDKVAVGNSEWVYLPIRVQGTSEYRPKIRFATNGGVYVQASQVLSGTETNIGTEVRVTGLVHAANTPIWVRARVTGANPTTIRMGEEVLGGSGTLQPAAWTYTATSTAAALPRTPPAASGSGPTWAP